MNVPSMYQTMQFLPYLLLLVFSMTSLSSSKSVDNTNYGILIDAGSTGSKIKIYRWNRQQDSSSLPDLHLINSTKFKPGLSEQVDDVAKLDAYIGKLIKWAAGIIPEEKQKQTPILILATAGMRFLDQSVSKMAMSRTRDILSNPKKNPFAPVGEYDVSVLSGEEEGAYAWIAANYLNGYFHQKKSDKHSVGVMEMGGGSTQIAYIPNGPMYDGAFHVTVANRLYRIYVHSYLDFGSRAIEREVANWLYELNSTSTVINPCMLDGDNKTITLEGDIDVTMEGSSDPELCREVLEAVLAPENGIRCQPKPCVVRNVYQPKLSCVKFYATSVFSYVPNTLKAVRPDGTVDIDQLLTNVENYCNMSLDEVVKKNPKNKKYASSNCLLGTYIPMLFQHYGFDVNTHRITLKSKINNQKIDWAMGAMLVKLSAKFAAGGGAVSMTSPIKTPVDQ